MSKECKYRLPCGWCDRRNKECTLPVFKITDITVHNTDGTDCAIHAPKRCGNCPDSTCVHICKITGKFHYYDDKCDCNTITAHNCSETLIDSVVKEGK